MFNIYYTIREGLCSQRIVFIYFTLCTLSKDQPMEGKYMLKNITSCSRDHLDMAKTSMDDLKSDILY